MKIAGYEVKRTDDGLIKIDNRQPMTRDDAELFLLVRVRRVEDVERLYRV